VSAALKSDVLDKRREQAFPKLTPQQIARLEIHGERQETRAGQVLVEPGTRHQKFYVVLAGSVEAVMPGLNGESLITVYTPGDFSGELSTLRGVAGFARLRVREGGAALVIDEKKLRDIVQTDAELSELMMRAFILRRVGLMTSGEGEVLLLGSQHSAATLRLREFLTRNSHPYVNVDLDGDADVQALLDRFHVGVGDVPVVIGHCGRIFRSPGIREIAEYLQMNPAIDESKVHDVVVIGAGPAGLAAAVYAASEGLDVLVVEAMAPGGQAGTSSRIENYLGFPTGISGQALAGRAFVQAQKFGAGVSVACSAVRLHCDSRPYVVELSDGRAVRTGAVVIASGAQYRELPIENLSRFVGNGVYYAATHMESKLCQGEEIVVVGGGNSAGQAAVFLAGSCRHVHLMVRSSGLAATMSRYLIRRIEDSPAITLRVHTQLVALEGGDRLERIAWRSASSPQAEQRDIAHVFLMTGALPNTKWLDGCVALDDKGFVRTGPDLRADELTGIGWRLPRAPYLHETSIPGVFAVGDVRSGSVKRIASAVGEGSISIQFVHRALQDAAGPAPRASH
jgi:thioredoxin reductase (NADPH)